MPHDISFETVPVEVARYLQEELWACTQIIAALVMTDEEVLVARQREVPGATMRDVQGWAQRLRDEMMEPRWREELVENVSRQGFRTNTHPGFSVSALGRPTPSLRHLGPAYADLERMLQAYADLEGEDVPRKPDESGRDVALTFWTNRLVEAGHQEKVAAWCMENGGLTLALSAACDRAYNRATKNESP